MIEVQEGILTDELIKMKAVAIAKDYKVENFKASTGWLTKFKLSNNLKLRVFHGESFTTDPINTDEFLKDLHFKIEEYGIDNVYNADKTGLFYKSIPSNVVCKSSRAGYKLLNDRISVLLCTNISGKEKLKPLIIGKFAKLCCFKNFEVSKFVNYQYSSKAWRTADIFNKWLLNRDMELDKTKNKKLLVVDIVRPIKFILNLRT